MDSHKALELYRDTEAFIIVNFVLRTYTIPPAQHITTNMKKSPVIQMILGIDSILTNISEEKLLYRGYPSSMLKAVQNSGVIVEKGYVSCTSRLSVAERFADAEG